MSNMKRHYGIELLRIILMMGIILLHYMGHGGLLEYSEGEIVSPLLWLLEAICYISVNCFVLITGFFQLTGKFKWSKFFALLLQIEFWSLVTYIVAVLIDAVPFSVINLGKALLPFIFDGYWFTTVYLSIYLISPFINVLLHNLTQRQHACLLGLMTFFCVFPILNESIRTGGGNSLVWFSVLYLWGAYIRKYGIKILEKTWICLVGWVACVISMWIFKVIDIPGGSMISSMLWSYSSLPVLFASIFVFSLFLKINIPQKIGQKMMFVSSCTLGVYLVHDSEWLRVALWNFINRILPHSFVFSNVWLIPIVIIAIFTVTFILEFLRNSLFKCLGIFKIMNKLTDRLGKNHGKEYQNS